MVWDSVNNQVLLYGGVGANNRYLGDLWSYSTSAGWSLLQCSNNGPGARSANAVWDGQEMLLLGGINRRGPLADFWSYTPGNNGGWQRLSDSPMGARAYQTLVWDSDDSRLYVFGGLDASGIQQNDFWSYTKGSGWSAIQPATTDNPLGRQQGIGTWDSTNRVMYLMGGWQDGQPSPFYGFWVFDPHQNAWALLTPLDTNGIRIIPGRTASAMVWDNTDHRAYIYGGAGNDKTHSSLNDLWMVS
jgi:Galactose oxidase, central domain